MEAEGRLLLRNLPGGLEVLHDAQLPVAQYRHLSHADIEAEKENCRRIFYSPCRIVSRMLASPLRLRNPFVIGSR